MVPRSRALDSFRDLLQRAKDGDAEALEALLVPHLPGLTGFVRLRGGALVRGRDSSEDVVQSVCRQVVHGIAGLRGETEQAFKQWLYAIALNRVRDRVDHLLADRRDVRREVPLPFDSHVDDGAVLQCYATLETPSQHAMTKEAIERIESAFDLLPGEYRDVLMLTRIAGLSYAEVAAQLGRSEGAVRQLLHRARARLAMLLE